MRILIFSQWYTPEPIPKPSELAEELKRRGHDVAVLTGFPNYPRGELYDGYKLAPMRREQIDGIKVTRTFEIPEHGRSSRGRILNYASFMISSLWGALFTPSCDVIYAWHPPLSMGVAATLISWIKRAPFVYDVQDIWPEAIIHSGWHLSPMMVRLMHALERFTYRFADRILVVTPGAKQNLIAKGVPAEKISVGPHWIDEKPFLRPTKGDELRREYNLEDRFVVMFAGNMGLMQSLETVIGAAACLRDRDEIAFVLVGDGVERPNLEQQAQGLDNVIFIERQPASRMPDFFGAADVLLVPLRQSELDDYIIPTKCLAYLAAGRPILAAAAGGAAQLITDADAGIAVTPDDPACLAEGVLKLYGMPVEDRERLGSNGRTFLNTHYAKQKVITLYENILTAAGGKG